MHFSGTRRWLCNISMTHIAAGLAFSFVHDCLARPSIPPPSIESPSSALAVANLTNNVECFAPTMYYPEYSACQSAAVSFASDFSSHLYWQLSHFRFKLPGYIRCPYTIATMGCNFTLDFTKEGAFSPPISPKSVAETAKELARRCKAPYAGGGRMTTVGWAAGTRYTLIYEIGPVTSGQNPDGESQTLAQAASESTAII